MVDIRTIRGKDKTDAFAKARVEYGGNFVILTSKDVKVGGFLGLGMKTEHELRIMLNNSIYDRKNNPMNEDKDSYSEDEDDMHRGKLLSDRIEMKKHSSETIDASEMADRIVSITKALKEKSANRNNNSSNNNSSRSAVQENSYGIENENIPEELLNDNGSNNSSNVNVIEEKIEDNNIREKSADNFIPLPNFSNNQYSSFQGSTFANMRNPMLSDYSNNNSFSPINNYSNFTNNDNSFMNNFNNNAMYNHNNTSNNNINNSQNNINNSVDDNVKKLVQEQIRDIIKEYLETNIPNINLNKNNSNNSNIYEDSKHQNKTSYSISSEEDEIKNAIEEIKENRRELRGMREHRELNIEENNLKENKNTVRDYFNDDIKDTNYNDEENDIESSSDTSIADGMEESFNYLRDREFPEEVLLELREYLLTSSNARFFQSKDVIREEVEKYFAERLILANGIEVGAKKKIIVFVGPTGVGKTTTIPKIAAQYMKSGKKVSFVTIDNYRIAAVDQLQRYASIMKVPFTSASTPEALRAEIRKMDNSSLLFIDTMGRSPKGAEDIVAMSKYFTTVGRFDMDIQLVMSATAKYKDALKILNGFKPTNYKGVILTKVDETDYLASSICAITKKKLPITYITHGQGVPKDISTAKKYGYKIIEGLFGH
ncbi:GTP-binding signal recognition particle SRP54 G- domain-containing protein [Brachyspira hampsonii]|uniref:Flagellar biosynthesis protein FlhF n=2 Tax=Brachyspira hampsonii TaxID=1287055 RepID=A0AAC9TW40_9SPIR|nr:GTP-binding signal recognition particle SRP54 G- domain-containing protein [Brachyspira hampsonii]ASJ22673.1 flagellar biosynthesis regulator FlhF [Brachyspira hampsonii]ELV05574.1 GTP-binding signal recognition particle SRP54 G- domain-containing protein [Brachyspira hampsonii 30599]MBW5410023.1 flagellar biosynthesis regulator FlhF [Brachyspira hampsonii]OEJ16471.1 flagellar biosynthesis regulator FlhF [Brachyspira hampsonii]